MESFIIGETLALQAATKKCVITQQTWKQIHADASKYYGFVKRHSKEATQTPKHIYPTNFVQY